MAVVPSLIHEGSSKVRVVYGTFEGRFYIRVAEMGGTKQNRSRKECAKACVGCRGYQCFVSLVRSQRVTTTGYYRRALLVAIQSHRF
jgi:hypothetical protein